MFKFLRRKDPMEEAAEIAEAFAALVDRSAGGPAMSNERALPHPKNTVRTALLLLIEAEEDAARREKLTAALISLAEYQRMSEREEAYVLRRHDIMRSASANPERMKAALFELEMLEFEARQTFQKLELAYELDVEAFERDLAELGFSAEEERAGPDPRPADSRRRAGPG